MAKNLTSPVDHPAANLYTTVRLDRKQQWPVKADPRRDFSKRNEDNFSESRLPLIMPFNTPSNTYTNDPSYNEGGNNNRQGEDVVLQEFTPTQSPPKHGPPIIPQKQKKKPVNYENAVELDHPKHLEAKLNGGLDDMEEEKSPRGYYAVPSSVFDRDSSADDYVEEDCGDGGGGGMNGYLTPTEFPVPSKFQFDGCRISSDSGGPLPLPPKEHGKLQRTNTSSNSNGNSNSLPTKERGGRGRRFDSGVGDCENSLGSASLSMSSAGSLSNPPVSPHNPEQHYEDIDYYSKEYKKRQEANKCVAESDQILSKGHYVHPPPRVDISGVTITDSRDFVRPDVCVTNTNTNTRDDGLHRHERVCENGTLPHMYSRLNIQNKAFPLKKTEGRDYCGCFLFFLVFIASMASLSISIYVLLSREDPRQKVTFVNETSSYKPQVSNSSYSIARDLEELKSEVEKLRQENVALKSMLNQQQNDSSASVQSLQEKVHSLAADQVNASQMFQIAANNLRSEIANISLVPGPLGPRGRQGVGNFSLCEIKSTSISMSASSFAKTYTEYRPAIDDSEDNVTLFAFCSFTGATSVALQYRVLSSKIQYRCECSGKVEGISRTTCTLNCFVCPRLNLHVS